jgi:hypothetical protein
MSTSLYFANLEKVTFETKGFNSMRPYSLRVISDIYINGMDIDIDNEIKICENYLGEIL